MTPQDVLDKYARLFNVPGHFITNTQIRDAETVRHRYRVYWLALVHCEPSPQLRQLATAYGTTPQTVKRGIEDAQQSGDMHDVDFDFSVAVYV